MRERKFNFEPLFAKGRIEKVVEKVVEKEPYVVINKAGVLRFPKWVFEKMNWSWQPVFIRFYFDRDKRALAWKFSYDEKLKDEKRTWRYLRIYKTGNSEHLQVSVRNFLTSLDNPVLPTPKLEIGQYTDTDGYLSVGELHYVVVPKEKRDTN